MGRGDRLKEVDVVFLVEVGELFRGRGAGLVHIHGLVHAIGEDDLVREGQAPGFHGMSLTKMHILHLGIGMVGDGIAFRPSDIVLDCLLLDSFIVGEGRR